MIAPARKLHRVLMTADPVGGVWTYALELARALEPHGVEVVLATMGARLTLSQRRDVASGPNITVCESSYKLEWMSDPWEDVERAGQWLLDLEERFQPDIVHLNGYCHGALPWRAPKLVVGHSCVLSWWRAVHGTDAPEEWAQYRESVMAGLHGADLVVAPSGAMLASLVQLYGPFRRTLVIPNGRDLCGVKPRSKHDMVLSAGRLWDAAKNISALTEVAPRLPWPVYVAGDESDPEGRSIQHTSVHRLGRLSPGELTQWLERASIYALPARYEPFGLSALEAAIAGCALVLGDIPSLREIWRQAAVFVPPNDTEALAHALLQLIQHPEKRARLASQARSVAAHYTPRHMADGYLQAYHLLLNTRIPRTETNDLALCEP